MRPKEGTKVELQRDISQIGLQVVFRRLFAGILQVAPRPDQGPTGPWAQSGVRGSHRP